MKTLYDIRNSTSVHAQRLRLNALYKSLHAPLDRIDVLEGHSGCINALSWARDGELLLSGGDDTTVRVWRIDPENGEHPYPLKCQSVIHTGHTANIFNAQMLPHSSRITTAAGDSQVRVCDVGEQVGNSGMSTAAEYNQSQAIQRVFKCHRDRVKRIVTETSPDLFLTVSEDGTVRQHDLRTSHSCGSECPAPLTEASFSLNAISLSPLTPYQYIVAGESPYGYLYDRRQLRTALKSRWGITTTNDTITTCVRRFGRPSRDSSEPRLYGDHITGCRMSESNGHEAVFSFSGDAVYLYSTLDSPADSGMARTSETGLVESNSARNVEIPSTGGDRFDEDIKRLEAELERDGELQDNEDEDLSIYEPEQLLGHDTNSDEDEDATSSEEPIQDHEEDEETDRPVIMPRARFEGVANVRTVKDVNFLGPRDEFIVSGSDDGNFFIWEKHSRRLHGIYEGDGEVVNVIEGHPHLPVIAISGIDYTVKLFAPSTSLLPSPLSHLSDAEEITRLNSRRNRSTPGSFSNAIETLLDRFIRSEERGTGTGQTFTLHRASDGHGGVQCSYQ